jgi:hypothetical protein
LAVVEDAHAPLLTAAETVSSETATKIFTRPLFMEIEGVIGLEG